MVVHAKGRHPGRLHDGGETPEIGTATKECTQANCQTCQRCEKRDPPRKSARQKQRGDCTGEGDVNGPGDGQGAVKVKSVTRLTTEEKRASREVYVFGSADLVREHEIQFRASASPAAPSVAEWRQ